MKYFLCLILIICPALAPALDLVESAPADSQFYQDFISAAWYEKHSDAHKAFEYYEALNAARPGDPMILESLTRAAMASGNAAAMDIYVPLLLEAAPNSADAFAIHAAWLWSKGDLNGALASYEHAIKLDPENGDIIFKYALLLAGIDADRAIAYLKPLVEEYPHMAGFIALQIADVYLKARDDKGAVDYLRQVRDEHPDLTEVQLGLIRIYEHTGQTSAAMAQYLEIEKAGFADAEILTKIGAYYVLENNKDLSKKYFLKAKDLDDGNPMANQFLSINAQEAGDWAAAVKYLTASRDYENNPALHVRAAYFYNRTGDVKKATETLKAAYNKFNKNAEIGLYYAFALIDEKDYKTAAKILREALETAPSSEAALFHLAYILERQKDYKEMEKYLQRLIAINPNHADALNFLGYYLVDKTKRHEEGGEYIKRAVALAPNNIAFIDSLAWYYYKTGDLQKAADLLQSIADNAGQDWEILLHAAVVHERLGDFAAAQKYYQGILNLNPQNKEAKAGLNRMQNKLK